MYYKKTSRQIIFYLIGVILILAWGGKATADTYGTNFESFSLGEVHNQDGWISGHGSSICPLYDVEIVSSTSTGFASLGTKSLRISNAITCGSFNDQTFSKSLVNEAGETSASTSTFSGGVRQPYFEAQWDFASLQPGSEQPGLSVVANPNRGDTMRMSWLQMADTPTGLQLNFEDYDHSISNFVLTPIATSLDRTVPHTVRMTVQFIDGPGNDIVKVYLDGALIHTGTTWEDYYRDFAGGIPHPVDSIMFREAGTAAPANLGKGFLIDNFSTFSGPVPVPAASLSVIKLVINDDGGTKIATDFPLFVNGVPIVSGATTTLPSNVSYTVTEINDPNYSQTFSGDCDSTGQLNLLPGDNKLCILTNNDIAPPAPPVPAPPAPVIIGGNGPPVAQPTGTVVTGLPNTGGVSPQISVTKVPSPLYLSAGGGLVKYVYVVSNPGTVALNNVHLTDIKCNPNYISGDINGNSLLDTNEMWVYTCSSNLTDTTTNIANAEGGASGQTAKNFAIATVVVRGEVKSLSIFPNTGVTQITKSKAISTFNRSLSIGSRGEDVTALQTALVEKGFLTIPPGVTKGYFGVLTHSAVIKYQLSAGLPLVGIFGPMTRAKFILELGN